MYLAYKGFKVANIPFINGIKLRLEKEKSSNIFFGGLCTSIDRLIDVRKNRLLSLNMRDNAKYVSEEGVGNEIREAKKFYLEQRISFIDVTNKSIEEIAIPHNSTIMGYTPQFYNYGVYPTILQLWGVGYRC